MLLLFCCSIFYGGYIYIRNNLSVVDKAYVIDSRLSVSCIDKLKSVRKTSHNKE